MIHAFLVDTYATERLKTLALWSQVEPGELDQRPEPRARTPREHFVHQCTSEDAWFEGMLGIDDGLKAVPERETKLEFLRHYALASERRLAALRAKDDPWFAELVRFFDAQRSRAWVLVRRIAHSAHHRGQLSALLRARGRALYSTYGPTADTGGLAKDGARVIYRYDSVEALLAAEEKGGGVAPLPGPGTKPPTERPT